MTTVIEAIRARPSECSDADGAMDVDMHITVDGILISGGVTLWPDPCSDGYSACGAPVDGWVCGVIYAMLPDDRSEWRKILSGLEAEAAHLLSKVKKK